MWLRLWVTAVLVGSVLADQGWQPVGSKPNKKDYSGYPSNTGNNLGLRKTKSVRLTVPEYVITVPQISDKDLQFTSTTLIRSDANNMAGNIDVVFENENSNVIKRLKIKDGVPLEKKPTFKALNDLVRLYNGNMLPVPKIDPVLKERLENNFLREIMKTTVIKKLFSFLSQSNKFLSSIPKQRELLKKIWFTTFTRSASPKAGNQTPTRYTSSAFAHIFRGEKHGDGISGMHNWYFMYEYLKKGQLRIEERHSFPYVDPLSKKVMVDLKFWTVTYGGSTKTSSVLFGISPELEIALATLCFIYRTKKPCILALGEHKIEVAVFPWDIRHQDILVISTYYPAMNRRFNTDSTDMAPFRKGRRRLSSSRIPRKTNPSASRIPVRVRG